MIEKIRIWDKKEKKMYYLERNDDNQEPILNDRFVVMLPTGNQDKNNKEIFESDLTKNHQSDCNLVFLDYDKEWRYTNHHAGSLSLHDSIHEIIGNEYENPDYEF